MPLDSHPTRPEAWVGPVPMDIEIDQYTVRADAQTGEWLGEPVFVGKVLESVWNKKTDTALVHYDRYEHFSDNVYSDDYFSDDHSDGDGDGDGKVNGNTGIVHGGSQTRAIEVVWTVTEVEAEEDDEEEEEDVHVPTCRAISEAHSLKGVVNIINDDGPIGPDMTPAQLAGQYAHEAADEAGYGCGEAEIEAWLESLSDAGAVFDVCDAIKHASAIERTRKC